MFRPANFVPSEPQSCPIPAMISHLGNTYVNASKSTRRFNLTLIVLSYGVSPINQPGSHSGQRYRALHRRYHGVLGKVCLPVENEARPSTPSPYVLGICPCHVWSTVRCVGFEARIVAVDECAAHLPLDVRWLVMSGCRATACWGFEVLRLAVNKAVGSPTGHIRGGRPMRDARLFSGG